MAVTPINRDLQVNGKLSFFYEDYDLREIGQISGNCYNGMGYAGCDAVNYYDPGRQNIPYYMELQNNPGSLYCLQCCGLFEDNVDTWDLSCELNALTAARLTSDAYGLEFRFGTKTSTTDVGNIFCPLKRNGCSYDADGYVVGTCDEFNNALTEDFLHGYVLTLKVEQRDLDFAYWRGVSSCSAEAIIGTTALAAGDLFTEKIIMIHVPTIQPLDAGKSLILLTLLMFLLYVSLYFCRRETCCVCQKKLVFFVNRCYLCRLFGADVPDPELYRMLQEKGSILQQEQLRPQRFPGAKKFISIVLHLYYTLTCSCVYTTIKNVCMFCFQKCSGSKYSQISTTEKSHSPRKRADSVDSDVSQNSPRRSPRKSMRGKGKDGEENKSPSPKKEKFNPNKLNVDPKVLHGTSGIPTIYAEKKKVGGMLGVLLGEFNTVEDNNVYQFDGKDAAASKEAEKQVDTEKKSEAEALASSAAAELGLSVKFFGYVNPDEQQATIPTPQPSKEVGTFTRRTAISSEALGMRRPSMAGDFDKGEIAMRRASVKPQSSLLSSNNSCDDIPLETNIPGQKSWAQGDLPGSIPGIKSWTNSMDALGDRVSGKGAGLGLEGRRNSVMMGDASGPQRKASFVSQSADGLPIPMLGVGRRQSSFKDNRIGKAISADEKPADSVIRMLTTDEAAPAPPMGLLHRSSSFVAPLNRTVSSGSLGGPPGLNRGQSTSSLGGSAGGKSHDILESKLDPVVEL